MIEAGAEDDGDDDDREGLVKGGVIGWSGWVGCLGWVDCWSWVGCWGWTDWLD